MTDPDRTLRGEQLGAELRRLREEAGLNLTDASRNVGGSASKLSRIENAIIGVSVEDVAGLLAIYGVIGDHRKEMLDLARSVNQAGWWQPGESQQRTVSTLEARADRIVNYESLVMPGMLQTVPYATGVMLEVALRSPDETAQRVAERVRRQGVLRRVNGPRFEAIISEAALRNPIAGWSVLAEQLRYLQEAIQHPGITIRIVPRLDHGHPGLGAPYVRYHLPGRTGIVYVEERTSGLFLETREQIEAYDRVTTELRQLALSEQDSLRLIARLAGDAEQKAGGR